MKTAHGHVGLYGSVKIERVFCQKCRRFAFVFDGILRCCDRPVLDRPVKAKRISLGDHRRRYLSQSEKDLQISEQEGKCFYCGLYLGGYVFRNGHSIRLKIEFDHLVPFSYSQDNRGKNFVATCHICNKIKHDLMFQTVEEALVYVRTKRDEKGYL